MSKNLFNSNTFNSKNVNNSNDIEAVTISDLTSDNLIATTATIGTLTNTELQAATQGVSANSTAIGQNTTAIGQNATAIGQNGTAIGQNTTAIGQNSTAIGQNTTAIGDNSSAISTIQETIKTNGQVEISTDVAPHLLVKRESVNGGDAQIRIIGARTGGNTKPPQLRFQNSNSSLVTKIAEYGRIAGEKVGDSSTNVGDLVFLTSSNGTTMTENMRMKSDNNITISAPTTTALAIQADSFSDATGSLRTDINSKQPAFVFTEFNPLSLDTTVTPNILTVDTTSTPSVGSNDLVLGGGVFEYLLNNYNKKLTIGSASTNQLVITSTSTATNNINVNDILSVNLAASASQTELGLVTGQLLDTELGNISFPTYTAESGGGIAVSGSREISLDYTNMSNPNTIPRTTEIVNNSTPQLLVTASGNTGRDAQIRIRGRRNTGTNNNAELRFENYDNDLVGFKSLASIIGRVTDSTNNYGGLLFNNFVNGTTRSCALNMSSSGNFNMGDGDTFQDNYKLKINGDLKVDNISTPAAIGDDLLLGITNATAPATTSNSYSYVRLKSTQMKLASIGTISMACGFDPDDPSNTSAVTTFSTTPTLTTISPDLTVSQDLTVSRDLTVTRNLTVSQDLTVTQDLTVSGTTHLDNISTNASTILIGNTNQNGASTPQNSYSWLEIQAAKAALAGPYLELRHSSTATGSSGTIGIKVASDFTTIFNKTLIDVLGTTSGNGNSNAALNVEKGILLLDAGSGDGYTSQNGVLQVNSRDSNKLKDGASFRPYNNNNHIINFCSEGGGLRGRIDGNNGSSISYRTSSDRRLKENVVDMDSCWDLVKELKPKSYNWIEDKKNDVGFIAQEVYALDGFKTMKPVKDPTNSENNKYYCCDEDCMCFDEDGYCEEPVMEDGSIFPHALDYGNFTPYLWKALQEAIVRIEELETKMAKMEGEG